MLGGKKEVDVQDTNSLEIDELANFAVSEHNARQVSGLGMRVESRRWRFDVD